MHAEGLQSRLPLKGYQPCVHRSSRIRTEAVQMIPESKQGRDFRGTAVYGKAPTHMAARGAEISRSVELSFVGKRR